MTLRAAPLDEARGGILARTRLSRAPIRNLPEHDDFSDFARADGVMVPRKIVWSRADYQVTFVVTAVRHDVQP